METADSRRRSANTAASARADPGLRCVCVCVCACVLCVCVSVCACVCVRVCVSETFGKGLKADKMLLTKRKH